MFPMPANVLHLRIQHYTITSQGHYPFPQLPPTIHSICRLICPTWSAPTYTRALLATEPTFLYRFITLCPSRSILIHPNVLVSLGLKPPLSVHVLSSSGMGFILLSVT
jgi:hypothetical protein